MRNQEIFSAPQRRDLNGHNRLYTRFDDLADRAIGRQSDSIEEMASSIFSFMGWGLLPVVAQIMF